MKVTVTQERWRDVPGFSGYRVSSDGRVESRKRRGPYRGLRDDWRPIKAKTNKNGYKYIILSDLHRSLSIDIHRLVAITFFEGAPNNYCVRHLNGIKSDNRLENLAWGTPLDNSNDLRHHRSSRGPSGESGPGHPKLTEETAGQIREERRLTGASLTILAKKFGVSKSRVSQILNGQRWSMPTQPTKSLTEMMLTSSEMTKGQEIAAKYTTDARVWQQLAQEIDEAIASAK